MTSALLLIVDIAAAAVAFWLATGSLTVTLIAAGVALLVADLVLQRLSAYVAAEHERYRRQGR